MRAEDLLDAIGQADDLAVLQATQRPERRSRRGLWVTVATLAACVTLVLCSPLMALRKNGSGAAPEQNIDLNEPYPDVESSDLVLAEDDVTVYHVKDGAVIGTVQHLPLAPQPVFAAWREANGIGDEVKLLDVAIEDNSVTVDNGDTVEHTAGDYFILRLTVTANLRDYYEALEETLLLDSLKRTMTGYSGIEFDEYYLEMR